MTDSRLYQATAIVLRSRDYGEGHRLISLFTREQGKVLAVARGVRKARARLASALQHFTLGEMTLAVGRRFDVITQVHVLDAFYGLRERMDTFAYASYFAELFDESLDERQSHPALFDLFGDALHRLVQGDPPDLLARYVEISLIAMLGYQPQLSECACCRQPLSRCNRRENGVAHLAGLFRRPGRRALPELPVERARPKRIAAGTVQVARVLLAHGGAALPGLHLSERLRREIESTFRDYLEFRLERRLQSTRFIRDWHDEENN